MKRKKKIPTRKRNRRKPKQKECINWKKESANWRREKSRSRLKKSKR